MTDLQSKQFIMPLAPPVSPEMSNKDSSQIMAPDNLAC